MCIRDRRKIASTCPRILVWKRATKESLMEAGKVLERWNIITVCNSPYMTSPSKRFKGYSGQKVQLKEWKHLQMKTLQGYLVLSIENNFWIVKDSRSYCIFACNVLLYYVAMQLWLWGPGPLHLLPPGRQPDNPLYHCTHYMLFDEYFPFPLTIRACT